MPRRTAIDPGWWTARLPWAATIIPVFLLTFIWPAAGRAQPALPAAIERAGPVSPEQRAELYRQLAANAEVLRAQSAVVKTVAKLIGPTVVHIEADVSTQVQYGRGHHVEEAGSGVIIELDAKHFVLTNRHVIRGATTDKIKINLASGRQIHPVQVWEDADTDIAVMALADKGLVAAPVGDSSKLEIGDFVLAVGSPFGLSHSVTYGIISAKGRRDLQLGDSSVRFQDFLQTDAAINPGNSGGPLVNLEGQVIGINTAIASNSGGNEGIGFAIPINMYMVIARQLIETGKVARAFLGVNLDSKFGPAMAAELGLPCPVGARITGITKGAPAESTDLRVGDVILQFNNIPIEDDAHLVNLVGLTKIGTQVPLVVYRDRKVFTITVAVGDRAQFSPQP
jgi:serine protease Do